MGDKSMTDKRRLRRLSPTLSGLDARKDIRKENKPVRTKIHQEAEGNFRKGKAQKAREAGYQAQKQQQLESLRVAEAESEVATRKGLAGSKSAGRRSLVKSTGSSLSSNLGGT